MIAIIYYVVYYILREMDSDEINLKNLKTGQTTLDIIAYLVL